MAKLHTGVDSVAVASSDSQYGHIAHFFEVGQYSLGASLSNFNRLCNIANSSVWVSAQVYKHVTVVGEECPFADASRRWDHTKTIAAI